MGIEKDMKDNKNIFNNDRDDCDNYINFVLKTNLILSLICEADRERERDNKGHFPQN